MEKKNRQAPDDFKGPRPVEEISYEAIVCSPEFSEGCKNPDEEQPDRVIDKEKNGK